MPGKRVDPCPLSACGLTGWRHSCVMQFSQQAIARSLIHSKIRQVHAGTYRVHLASSRGASPPLSRRYIQTSQSFSRSSKIPPRWSRSIVPAYKGPCVPPNTPIYTTMSFGYGAGDIVAIGTLVWNVYSAYAGAPEQFRNFSQEILSLHVVVKKVEDQLGMSGSGRTVGVCGSATCFRRCCHLKHER